MGRLASTSLSRSSASIREPQPTNESNAQHEPDYDSGNHSNFTRKQPTPPELQGEEKDQELTERRRPGGDAKKSERPVSNERDRNRRIHTQNMRSGPEP